MPISYGQAQKWDQHDPQNAIDTELHISIWNRLINQDPIDDGHKTERAIQRLALLRGSKLRATFFLRALPETIFPVPVAK